MTKKQIIDKIQYLPDDMELMIVGDSNTDKSSSKLNENSTIEEYREYLNSIKYLQFPYDIEKSFLIFKETGFII